MGHSGNPDEFFEILCNELRAIVGNNPWTCSRVFLLGPLKDGFYVTFSHLLSDLPMDDRAAASIEEAAQVVEGATDVEVRDIHMPVLMRQRRLNEPGSFERRFLIPLLEQACLRKNTPSTGRADGHNVLVQHHEG